MQIKTGAYTADFSTNYEVFTLDNLAQYDAILLNNTTKLTAPDPADQQALLDFIRNGKGLIGIHSALDWLLRRGRQGGFSVALTPIDDGQVLISGGSIDTRSCAEAWLVTAR